MEIADVVVADASCFVVSKSRLLLIHLASGRQVDDAEDILGIMVLQEVVLTKLFVLDQICEDSVEF